MSFLFLDHAVAQWPWYFDPYRSRPLYELPQPPNWIKLTTETQPPLAKEVAMPVNDDKLTQLAQEVMRLRSDLLELSARQHVLEARMITISEMFETAGERET